MRIEDIGLWVEDLDKMRAFYETYFGARANDLYHNPQKVFKSYFLTFVDDAYLELMTWGDIAERHENAFGCAHLAYVVGDEADVDVLMGRLREAGYAVVGEPRRIGDGCYESVVLDTEGNQIEITAA
ncbi:glyoxalase/bleomycin resistance/extradiol dioxygenase family protein [Suicoccus acidiformans]|uniref:Glyoxalase/bleomycin resistance/extradiol dioxygenase family protein n=2 Tax=Suicoccus acidiformans TaxID=2036206 RepID=A0A347WI74_9LACT|nr:VOC family protein [Suicoccus acidiformans]AXY24781.1 glyoxalase/bleomycin resistance/extradiol dioxygenase family protein [Suicoccus acidiformans]